ncbi:MAG TPA: ABC transporter substrate-binding protein [Trebonia sp.]|jgi:NitT/TauT family transport system substrate-binding protein|nr:ABC transporter substrate-binding protein [Trebonia sp.]
MRALASGSLAAISAMALASCTSSTAAMSSGPEMTSIVVDSVPAADEAGLYVAQYEGYFKQEGLNVTIKPVAGGEAAIPDLQSGAAQFVGGNYVSFILAQIDKSFDGKPADFRIVAAGSQMTPGTEPLYVRKNSPYQTIADLAKHHASVGLNTGNDVGQVLFGALYQSEGYSFFKNARQVTPAQGFPALLQMLKNGQVDASWLPTPFGTMAEQQYGAEEIADFDSGATKDFPFTGYIGSTPWVKSHPQTVAAFVRAILKGQQAADAQQGIAETAMAKYTNLPPLIAHAMAFDDYPLSLDIPQLQRVPDEMFQFGLTDGLKKPFQISGMVLQPQ